ncbi:helix-turn-helix transcriptional regulator [Nocardia salmonicida]|jgi:predicted ArsR family transcriptional regulator|uniref:helix-turn-helix transcriptional regulator n=1 Tax=Nocardia salmonicida TaxID=53431 RepID=UPI0007A4B754|nr:helix-turn-helix domain-containing protein [Nocardia salmonicida]
MTPTSGLTPNSPGGGRRGEVLAVLRASPVALSIVELAARLDVHPNTVRFHLEALVTAGQAERVESPRIGPGRPPQVFRAHPGMDPAGPRNYRLLADILTAQFAAEPDPAARAVRAGQAWGKDLAASTTAPAATAEQAVDDMVRMLDDLGFEPDTDDARTRIRLRHCPFLDLAASHATVVCPLHLGLMQGVLQGRSAPVTVDRLEPFAAPDLCLAHLAPAGDAPAQPQTGSTP